MTESGSQTAEALQASGLLRLARLVTKLKSVPRTGWIDRGVASARVESVAGHTLGVALLAWVCAIERQAAGERLDPQRALKLALLHDLAEAEVGDRPPYDPASLAAEDNEAARRAFLERRHIRDAERDTAKRAAEAAVMDDLLAALPEPARAELATLWAELQAGTSAESRFVKQIDRLETFLQSRHYQQVDPDLPVASFRREVLETIDDPLLAAIRDAALADNGSGSR